MKVITSITALLSLVSVLSAQNVTLKETYPADGATPVAKPEWLELIKNANITKAPVLKNNGDNGKRALSMLELHILNGLIRS